MSCFGINRTRTIWMLTSAVLSLPGVLFAQSDVQEYTLVVNGQSVRILLYRISGQAFVDIEALARIANGSATIEGHRVVLSLPPSSSAPSSTSAPRKEMTKNFMTAALSDLALIKDWHTTIAYALQRGVPGDGSRLIIFHDRAAEGLRLATVEASSQ